jgi:hypothetical protein
MPPEDPAGSLAAFMRPTRYWVTPGVLLCSRAAHRVRSADADRHIDRLRERHPCVAGQPGDERHSLRCRSPRKRRGFLLALLLVLVVIRHDRREVGRGRLLRWRGLARKERPYLRRGVCDPARAHWYGRAAERPHRPVASPPPLAGAWRGCARHTKRRVATGLHHRRRRDGGDRGCKCDGCLSACVLSGPQPDRTSLQQTQGAPAQGRGADNSRPLAKNPLNLACRQREGMPKFLPPRRL